MGFVAYAPEYLLTRSVPIHISDDTLTADELYAVYIADIIIQGMMYGHWY